MDFSELIAAADPSIFTESIKAWVSGLNINSVIMLIMMIFMIVGAIDRIRGNKLGYGEKFEDGFNAIGSCIKKEYTYLITCYQLIGTIRAFHCDTNTVCIRVSCKH